MLHSAKTAAPTRNRTLTLDGEQRGLMWVLSALTALILMFAAGEAGAKAAPDSFADLAEKLLPAVVNVSTTQVIEQAERPGGQVPMPQFPPGSPFDLSPDPDRALTTSRAECSRCVRSRSECRCFGSLTLPH